MFSEISPDFQKELQKMERTYLFKRASGVFFLQYADGGGRTRQVTTRSTNRADAVRFMRQFNAEEHGRRIEARTISVFSAELIRSLVGVKTPKTGDCYKDVLKSFTEYAGGDRSLESIGVREIEQYISAVTKRSSLWTARKHFGTLAAAFEKAKSWGFLRENPFRRLKKPNPGEPAAVFLSPGDFASVLSAITNPDVRAAAIIGFNTGARRGEILALKWHWIDFTSRILRIQNDAEFTTKSKRSRAIPLNDAVFKVLKERHERRTDEADAVFFIKPTYLTTLFKDAARLAFGQGTRIHFHSLRHSFCSELMRLGAGAETVRLLAGHSSLAVTQRYSHAVPADSRNAVNLLGRN